MKIKALIRIWSKFDDDLIKINASCVHFLLQLVCGRTTINSVHIKKTNSLYTLGTYLDLIFIKEKQPLHTRIYWSLSDLHRGRAARTLYAPEIWSSLGEKWSVHIRNWSSPNLHQGQNHGTYTWEIDLHLIFIKSSSDLHQALVRTVSKKSHRIGL